MEDKILSTLPPVLSPNIALAFEAGVVVRVMGVAGTLVGGVKVARVLVRWRARGGQHRGQVAAAAKPAFGGDNHAGVHVCRGCMRVGGMGDDRNARSPKARVFFGSGHLASELLGKLAIDGGDMHARLFENLPAQHRHLAAAQIYRPVAALPFFAHESGTIGLQSLKARA